MWFSDIAAHPDPGNPELIQFLSNTERFLDFVLVNDEFNFLWEDTPFLHIAAKDTFKGDVIQSIERLKLAINDIPQILLYNHGLKGRPLKFKFAVLDSIGRGWEQVKGKLIIRDWLKRILDAIDAILDSILAAVLPVGNNLGVGGLIKEFKDAVSALIKTV